MHFYTPTESLSTVNTSWVTVTGATAKCSTSPSLQGVPLDIQPALLHHTPDRHTWMNSTWPKCHELSLAGVKVLVNQHSNYCSSLWRSSAHDTHYATSTHNIWDSLAEEPTYRNTTHPHSKLYIGWVCAVEQRSSELILCQSTHKTSNNTILFQRDRLSVSSLLFLPPLGQWLHDPT